MVNPFRKLLKKLWTESLHTAVIFRGLLFLYKTWAGGGKVKDDCGNVKISLPPRSSNFKNQTLQLRVNPVMCYSVWEHHKPVVPKLTGWICPFNQKSEQPTRSLHLVRNLSLPSALLPLTLQHAELCLVSHELFSEAFTAVFVQIVVF
jgi:hypothetical protein